MRALPSGAWSDDPDPPPSPNPPFAARWMMLAEPVAHVFTHFSLALRVHATHVGVDDSPPGDGEWWPIAALDDAGLPTLFAKAAQVAMKEGIGDARH